jgi:hypothetical protein
VRLPGIAPGPSTWQEAILLLNHSREIKRAGSDLALPARASAEPTLVEGPAFQQRTNTSWRSTRSQPAVSRRLFRCLGAHLLRSPSVVNSIQSISALFPVICRQISTVESLGSPMPLSALSALTSSRCRFAIAHGSFAFRCSLFFHSHRRFREIKNPAYFPVSRV